MMIGDRQRIITPNRTFELTEEMFIGVDGYTRVIAQHPEVGRTTTGTRNYKQPHTDRPIHKFRWNIVMDETVSELLVAEVRDQTVRYKNNIDRNFPVFILEDMRMAKLNLNEFPIEIVSTLPEGEVIPNIGSWVFPKFNILITSITWDYYCKDMMEIKMEALELPREPQLGGIS